MAAARNVRASALALAVGCLCLLGASPAAGGQKPLQVKECRQVVVEVEDHDAKETGERVGKYVCEKLASGELKMAVTDPDNPANWPRVLNVWRANLLGSSSKGNEYFLRHLLGADSNLQATPTE